MKATLNGKPQAPPLRFLGRHRVARPLPEPPRTRHVSKRGMPATDELGKLLEEWMSEISVGYTEPAD